jgi:hypothetical protein
MMRVATWSASLRRAIGVGPAWASMPVTTTSYQRRPSTPVDHADGLARVFEHRALLDVGLEVRAEGVGPGLLVARVADAAQLVADGLAVDVLRGVGVSRVKAGKHPRAHHHGHEARALLVGPEDDLEGRLGLDAVVVEGAHHLQAREHAVVAVKLAARGLRVDVAAARDGRKGRVAPRAAHEDVANLVDGDRQARGLRPAYDEVAPLAVEVGEGQTTDAALRGRADARELHQGGPETVAVDAEGGVLGVHGGGLYRGSAPSSPMPRAISAPRRAISRGRRCPCRAG